MKKILLSALLLGAAYGYSQDSGLDLTFGVDGKVLTTINNTVQKAYGMVLQPDGKIVVAGYTYSETFGNDFVCIRYNNNGSLDTSFGNNGIATFDIQTGSDDKAYSIDIESSGKLVLAGYSDNGSNKNATVIRLNTDGTLDNSFGNSGKVLTDFTVTGNGNPTRHEEYKVVKIHHVTGNIVVGGTSFVTNTDSDPIFARYTSNGELDTTFSTDGKIGGLPDVITGWTFLWTIEDLVVKSNGKITAVGWVKPTTGATFYNADHYECRINTDGTLDTSFSQDGYDSDLFATSDHKTNAVLLNLDDSFYFGGHYDWNNDQTRIYVGSTTATGTTTDHSPVEFWAGVKPYCYALAKDSNGRFLTGGSLVDAATGNSTFMVLRLTADQNVDTSFGTGGFITTNFNTEENEAYDMKIQADGKIILAGFSGNKIALARYTADALDSESFNYSTVKIYPNPASDIVNINLAEDMDSVDYRISDINGRIIQSGKLSQSNNAVNVETLEKGVYFITLGNSNNYKFIKK